MGVPKQRHTRSRRNKRRANIFINATSLVKCLKCTKLVLPHTTCPNCGYYKKEEVIDVMKKLTKKEKKLKEKELASEEEKKPKGELSAENLSKK